MSVGSSVGATVPKDEEITLLGCEECQKMKKSGLEILEQTATCLLATNNYLIESRVIRM
jgi:hypothetical protein